MFSKLFKASFSSYGGRIGVRNSIGVSSFLARRLFSDDIFNRYNIVDEKVRKRLIAATRQRQRKDFDTMSGLKDPQATNFWYDMCDEYPESKSESEPQVIASWQKYLSIWYSDEQKFETSAELLDDAEQQGWIAIPRDFVSARLEFINHLMHVASEMVRYSDFSPFSNLVQGPAGIGKSTVIAQIGSRLPLLFPDVCCVGVRLSELDTCPLIRDMVEFAREKSKKEKFLFLLDDCDEVFRKDSSDAFELCRGIHQIYQPDVGDVVVQVFGSSLVLTDLFQRKLPADLVSEFSGYKNGTYKLNSGKLIPFTPTRPLSKQEVGYIGKNIGDKFDRNFGGGTDESIASWYMGGIPRYIEHYVRGRSHLNIMSELWDKLDVGGRMFYRKIAEYNEIDKSIKTFDDVMEIVVDDFVNPFSFIKPYPLDIIDDSKYNIKQLLNMGSVFRGSDIDNNLLYPTYPLLVLLCSIVQSNQLDFQLFLNSVIEPGICYNDVAEEYNTSLTNNLDVETLQRLRIKLKCFDEMTCLPDRSQCLLKLHQLSQLECDETKFYGLILIDILNFGAVNSNISKLEADKMLFHFGVEYQTIVQKYHKNEMDFAQLFHRSGDEFMIVCEFDNKNENVFESLTNELSKVVIEKKTFDNQTIPCYGRIGGYFYSPKNHNPSIVMEQVERIEYSIKDPIAQVLGFQNAVAMKDFTKKKGNQIPKIPTEHLEKLYKIDGPDTHLKLIE